MPEPNNEKETPQRRRVVVGEELVLNENFDISVVEISGKHSLLPSIVAGAFSGIISSLLGYTILGSIFYSKPLADIWYFHQLPPVFGLAAVAFIAIFGYFWIKNDE